MNQVNPDTTLGRATAKATNDDGSFIPFTIKAQGMTVKSEKILWIINWGTEEDSNWHTEFVCEGGKYRSYKQSQDGGTIEFHA